MLGWLVCDEFADEFADDRFSSHDYNRSRHHDLAGRNGDIIRHATDDEA